MAMRPSWDEYFLGITSAVSARATCDRGRSGAVLVKDNRVLLTGYVGAPPGLDHCDDVGHLMKTVTHEDGSKSSHCVRTLHAEQNVICHAARFGVACLGATLYCKMVPCSVCAGMIIAAGISRVVCEKHYHQGKASILEKAGIEVAVINNETEKYDNQ